MTTSRTPLTAISNNDTMSSPADTGKRRKSGRAVRVPDKFVPEVASSQPAPTSSKRKRAGEDPEDDASEIDEEAEASDATVESAAEEEAQEIRKRARKPSQTKKPAAKKPKVNGTANHVDSSFIHLPSRTKKPSRKVAIAERGVEGLYAEVYTSGDAVEDIVNRWLEKYRQDKSPALQDLVNLTLRSAGCKLEVSEEDIDDPDNADSRLADLQDQFVAQNVSDYPLISKAKSTHDFRLALTGFFETLIETIHQSKDLYANDGVLISNLEAWLAPMSSSSSRPFRHTATLVAISIMTALSTVAHGEIEHSAQVQRQLEAAKKNKRPNAALVAEFQKKVNDLNFQEDIVKHNLKSFFDTVYVHRYRDVDPRIRMDCAEGMGSWVLAFPSRFANGENLRYLGWMLSDFHGPMRQEVIKQIHKIVKKQSPSGLRSFIERFRPRLIEIATRDTEAGVRASTVELLNLIREAQMLEPNDIDIIGRLIFDSEPKVRKAVVGFFAANINDTYDSIIEELGGDEALEGLGIKNDHEFHSPRPEWIQYKCLAQSLLSYDVQDAEHMDSQIDTAGIVHAIDVESRFTLAANALYDKVPELQEWQMLAGYLLFDHTTPSRNKDSLASFKAAFKPTEREEQVLLEILSAVVKVNLSNVEIMDRGKSAKTAKAEKTALRNNAARRLAELIPKLLKKYGADPQTATVVLRLEHILDLDVFAQNNTYATLLDGITSQFSSHADRHVLAEARAGLLHAQGYEQLEEVIEGKMSALWDDNIARLQKINASGELSARGTLKPKLLGELVNILARLELSEIASSVEVMEAMSEGDEHRPIEILIDIVGRGLYEDSNDAALDDLEDEAVQCAIRSVLFYFMWKTRDISQSLEAGEEISVTEIDNLKNWQELFASNLIASFSSRSSVDQTRILAANALLDLHVLLASTLRPFAASGKKGDHENVQVLVTDITPVVQHELTLLFDTLEKHYAKKSKKKLAEPGDDEDPEDMDSEPEDDEADDMTNDAQHFQALRAEIQLCEFTARLVLAIIAQVIDASGPHAGKLKLRIQRNRLRLGHNFKEAIAYLDEPKSKAKKSHKSRVQKEAETKKKSAETVEESEEEDDPFAEPLEEVEEEPEPDVDGDQGAENNVQNDGGGDDIMGD